MKDGISTPTSDGADLIGELRFEWIVTGLDSSPAVSHEGFGHEMLPRSLPYDLGAETSIEFKGDCMRFSMNPPGSPDMLADPVE
jgi:hypothetical protein